MGTVFLWAMIRSCGVVLVALQLALLLSYFEVIQLLISGKIFCELRSLFRLLLKSSLGGQKKVVSLNAMLWNTAVYVQVYTVAIHQFPTGAQRRQDRWAAIFCGDKTLHRDWWLLLDELMTVRACLQPQDKLSVGVSTTAAVGTIAALPQEL